MCIDEVRLSLECNALKMRPLSLHDLTLSRITEVFHPQKFNDPVIWRESDIRLDLKKEKKKKVESFAWPPQLNDLVSFPFNCSQNTFPLLTSALNLFVFFLNWYAALPHGFVAVHKKITQFRVNLT